MDGSPSGTGATADPTAIEAVAHCLAQRQADRALALLDAWPLAHQQANPGQRLRGRALRMLGQSQAALTCLRRASELDPTDLAALESEGNLLSDLGRPQDALACYDAALAIDPRRLDCLYNRAVALHALSRRDDALAAYDTLLACTPDDALAHVGRGNVLLDLRRLKEAEAAYAAALRVTPALPQALHNLGVVQQELRAPHLAARAYERLRRAAPDWPQVDGKLLHARMLACDWQDHAALLARVEAALRQGAPAADPFTYQGVSQDPALQKVCAELEARRHAQPPARQLARGGSLSPDRLRVGYVSGEFRQQATSVLMVELLERHDRRGIEVVAFDNGWDDGSPLRQRVVAAVDEVVDIASLTDADAARAVHTRGIDILVDLNGYFGLARPGLFGWRPSPIQVNYLGFPGTSGAAWMDYLIADRRLVGPDDEVHYSECVVCLPGSYQPNDSRREAAGPRPERAALGLPDDAFVFCCFNNNYKITPDLWAVWTSLLRRLPGSVLWLLADNTAATDNLRREAARQGVDPGRLHFAPRVALPDHLARHALADLFLDTLPCNAHTTASDALWTGLPVLTCTGTTFSGRVATSLLHALGLPELITTTLQDYEAQAMRLATDPVYRAGLRDRLVARRSVLGAESVRLPLEAAYRRMAERHRSGLPPEPFEVGV